MGYNLISGCHNCKVAKFHYRGAESKTILPFYIKHKRCTQYDKSNVETIMDNHGTDPEWSFDPSDGGYPEDKDLVPWDLEIKQKRIKKG